MSSPVEPPVHLTAVHTFFYDAAAKRCAGSQNTPAGPAMPTCRNCGNTSTFIVSLTVTTVLTDDTLGPPRLHTDIQCRRCDSTHIDGDPDEILYRRDYS